MEIHADVIAIGSVPVEWDCIKKDDATQIIINRGDDLTNTLRPTNQIMRNASHVSIFKLFIIGKL